MSLSKTEIVKQFEVGVIISRNFDDGDLLDNNLGPHLAQISHIHTNAPEPGSAILERFARDNAVPFTVWPTSQHAFVSVNKVLEHSKFIYIITDNKSKIATMAEQECKKKSLKYKIIQHEPIECWRMKVAKVEEIVSAMTPEDIAGSEAIKSIQKVI